MRQNHLIYLACPKCKADLAISEVSEKIGESIKNGTLQCLSCDSKYNISNHIPRFVPQDNYASGFGFEWSKHSRTQYDSYSGVNVSEKRFFEETRWSRNLEGESILEVGSGSGRFTEQAASTNAMVVSIDFSYAVDANYESNGNKENVLIIQGDIYALPIKQNYFDKVFCFGVLQHTPRPKEAFLELYKYPKHGGTLVIDIYRKLPWPLQMFITKYWVRPFTRQMEPATLYNFCSKYVRFMWPIAKVINKLPKGNKINRQLLIADYRGVFDLSDDMLKEWAILDTFDMLSPAYDYPQTLETIEEWFAETGLKFVEVTDGYLGPLGRGTK
ncbi:2-polyprenyl-3-methyl-5-hydroxy-6-metoxy-1, 4-benzoquinol methylase [uncultured Woeseiaceae bacterium]|uniref:2-polyprenyl-3-methyl-5-hydroxy-6-metoxy-1, 4-benzoquinol methylase n=1 Tax=uncultured Woeseiaceae bacterium TaxID=1983305 RepID=A0A7D9D3C2_9GAMM|nr:2-polyprenyl-3-methyl-5-hydroxy-6-metoxy-1, 4-benzoquinol methylase [uncultured Woeseiaceae bacterium]